MDFLGGTTYEHMSELAATRIIDVIKNKPDCTIALPTGSSPIGVLEKLVEEYKQDRISYKNLKVFSIDEYVALPKDNEQSYYYFLNEYFYKHVDIQSENTFVPDVFSNLEMESRKYEHKITIEGEFDLILLGIGHDGHIGFNEPADKLQLYCHVENLDYKTIEANARFFDTLDEVPKQALTLGIRTILMAKKIILIASGKSKAKVIKQLFETKELDPQFPASFLHLHRDVTIICDQDAMSEIGVGK